MSTSKPLLDPRIIVNTLVHYRWRWIVPTVLITLVAAGYALLRPTKWEASQALLVRDEATGDSSRPGRFEDAEFMKTAQETVLEVAKSRTVLSAALVEIGPARGKRAANWPTAAAIEELRAAVKVAAPRGAEFGRTEVFYVKVKDKDRKRAMVLAAAVADQLDARLRALRDEKAKSLVQEVTKTVNLAKSDLQKTTVLLSEMEQHVGGDLAELRILNESSSGESNLRRTLISVQDELRRAQLVQTANQQLMAMLVDAREDPSQIVVAPRRLLESQPALSQLKDGLVAAKLKAADLQGGYRAAHPKVRAAVAAQVEIEKHIHDELQLAMSAMRAESKLNATEIEDLLAQKHEIESRMGRLAAMRADYNNLVKEVEQRGAIFSETQHELADVRANQAAAQAVSLLTRLDSPTTGDSPVGPGRSMIGLCGLFGGLITGFGIVFLTAPVLDLSPETSVRSLLTTRPDRLVGRAPTRAAWFGSGLSLKELFMSLITPSAASRN